ncbi:OmpA family protein [Frigidibacter sp. MR17.24]|uniref:OmpA family protein n=1 Tax=Frigidibacter sp. MR17.24 TaxID=3127345 RepID=UPI003012C30B
MRFDPKTLGIHWIGGAAFVAAAGISVIGATWAASAVEDLSARAVRAALAEEGFTWAAVQPDGLSVVLTGEAPSEPARFRALNAAGSVVDASRIVDAMSVPDPAAVAAPDFSVEILRNDDGVSLIGLVPVSSGRDDIVETVRRRANGAPVTDMLEAAEHDAPAGWKEAVDFGLQALGSLPRSKISIEPGRVAVTAITDSIDEKSALDRRLAAAAPDGIELVLDISAPRPVITPFTLRFLMEDGGPHFDACSADTERARDRILAAGRAAGAPDGTDCTIGMGTPSPAWGRAAEQAIRAIADLGAGSVTMSDADVSLIAADSVSQPDFDRVVGELDAALPEVFSLTAVLTPKPAAAAATQGPPQVTASLAEDGRVQIRGRLPDALTRDAVESYAHAHFGSGNVYVATRLDDSVPEGWPARVLAGLEALDRVHDGRMVVEPDLVRIEGRTGSRETSAQIAQLLSQRLGEGQEFDIRVAYDRKLDASLALPSAQQCEARLTQAQAAEKINFEPGSARLAAGSREIMDRIADILRQCADYQFEVSGHTDSQGRDSMNLALSEDRAEAVVEALMGRRVLTANLHPTGYGETRPIADNGTEDGREQNRRIEFTLMETDDGAATAGAAPDAGTAAQAGEAQEGDAQAGEVQAQPVAEDTARPQARPGDLAVPDAPDTAAPSADPAVADAVDEATGTGDEAGDEAPMDAAAADEGPGSQGSGDEGSGDEGDPEGADLSGPEIDPATGEPIPGTETGAAEAAPVTEAPAADATAADSQAADASTSEPGVPDAPVAETTAADAPLADAEGAPTEEEIVIEVRTPDDDTVTPPARPAAIEARAARQ